MRQLIQRGHRRWLGAAGVAVALAFGASQAFGAGAAPEAEPGGPPACSVVAADPQFGGVGIDFWLQCNYHVSHVAITSSNRKLSGVSKAPELVGAGPEDAIACRMARQRRVVCGGGLTAFARIHAQLAIDEPICANPHLRLNVVTTGGPQCTGECPGIEFRSIATNATAGGKAGCVGG